MEKGTDALSATVEPVGPRELDPIELSEEDVETIRATLDSSTEFKKVRLLYFTDDFKRWVAEHG